MRAEALFTRRCEEIIALQADAKTEVDLLDIAAKLRQLLFDKYCLTDTVNVDKIKLRFVVGTFNIKLPPPKQGIMALGDGLDPETGIPSQRRALTRKQFGRYRVLYLNANPVTVKDIIKYTANVTGGVHLDPNNSQDEYQNLKLFEDLRLKGVSTGGAHLQAIARVVIRTLEPLTTNVRSRLEGQ